MTWNDIADMTNDGGRDFLRWVKQCEPIGTTERGARQGEFLVIYKTEDNRYRTFVLSKKDEKNDGSCFFGPIRHYSLTLQQHAALARGERYPGRYCRKTEKEIEDWLLAEFGIPKSAHWVK